MNSQHRISAALAAVAVAGLIPLTGCSDDTTAAGNTSPGSDPVSMYCARLADTEAFAGELIAELGNNPDDELVLDAERQVLGYIKASHVEVADLPDAIAADAVTFLNAFERRLGPGNPQPTPDESAAEQRLLDWEAENCS